MDESTLNIPTHLYFGLVFTSCSQTPLALLESSRNIGKQLTSSRYIQWISLLRGLCQQIYTTTYSKWKTKHSQVSDFMKPLCQKNSWCLYLQFSFREDCWENLEVVRSKISNKTTVRENSWESAHQESHNKICNTFSVTQTAGLKLFDILQI